VQNPNFAAGSETADSSSAKKSGVWALI
jgi:hypothetical protein